MTQFSMQRADAARHLGMSVSSFDRAVERGDLPPPRAVGSMKLWVVDELEARVAGRAIARARSARAQRGGGDVSGNTADAALAHLMTGGPA